jgi:hypothetical protein
MYPTYKLSFHPTQMLTFRNAADRVTRVPGALRRDQEISPESLATLDPTQYPIQWVLGPFPQEYTGRRLHLTTHHHLKLDLRANGATHIYIYIYPLSGNILWCAYQYFHPIYVQVSKAASSLIFTYHIDGTTKNTQITQCCYIRALRKKIRGIYVVHTVIVFQCLCCV